MLFPVQVEATRTGSSQQSMLEGSLEWRCDFTLVKDWCGKLENDLIFFQKYKKISTPTAQWAGGFLKGSVTCKARPDRVHAPLEGFPLHLRKPQVRTQSWNQQSERIKSSVGFWHSDSEDLGFCNKCSVFRVCRRIIHVAVLFQALLKHLHLE